MDEGVVLLVDDNHVHQYALGKHLKERGYEVLHAGTGAQTLSMAAERLPDAILLDINLPDIDGFEICEALKKDPLTNSIPVIFHSATHDTQQAQAQAQSIGAFSFLSYPIHVDHLISVLRGSMRHSRRAARQHELKAD